MESTTKANNAEEPSIDSGLAADGKKIAQGGAFIIVGTLIAQAASMGATLWIARILGPDRFGLFSLASSIVLPISALAVLGLTATLVRFIPVQIGEGENRKVSGTVTSALLMAGSASILATFALIAFSPMIANRIFSEPRLEPVLQVLALTIPLIVLTSIATASTRGAKLMHFDAIVQITGPVFRLIAWIFGLLLLSNLLMAAIVASLAQWLAAVLVALGFTFWVFRKYFQNGIEWSFRPLWRYSTPLIFSSLMYIFVPRMDRIILGVVSDAQKVGIYSAAASLVFILNLVHASTVKTFLPVVADAYNRISFDRARMLYISVTRWDSRLTFLVVVSSTLIAQEALALLGPSYASALMPFVILAASVFVGTLPGPTGALLQMTNRQRIDAANAVVFFVLYPSIQMALVLWIGWIGVAIGVLVVTITINVVQTVEIRWLYGFHPFQKDHSRFTVLSLVVVGLCSLAAITQPLIFRLALLGIVISSFFAFFYVSRTPADTIMFRLMVDGTPLGSFLARFG